MITLKNKQAINTYETILILKPEQSEDDTVRIKFYFYIPNVLAKNGAVQIYTQNKGRNHLTYLIKKYNDGIYIQINYRSNGQIVEKLEKILRFDEQVIRHLTLKA
nr:ribosomal protein S6 [Pseudoerythrocladia kornmannii]